MSKSILWVIIGVLGLVYMSLFSCGRSGWGYAGYRGYGYGPSFFYWGGPRYYPSAYGHSGYGGSSHRSGSVSGPRHRGGGFRSGK